MSACMQQSLKIGNKELTGAGHVSVADLYVNELEEGELQAMVRRTPQ